MFKNPEDSAISAVLALSLEVSGNPKAGNVDREHDFEDLKYEDFLISAITAFPYFLKTAKKGEMYLSEAIAKGREYGVKTNVHFGAFLLLFPLVTAWRSENCEVAGKNATEFLKNTSHLESLRILKAFQLCNPRVLKTGEMSLESKRTEMEIIKRKINVYEWMKLAPKENLIAFELLNEYKISVEGAKFLLDLKKERNESVVLLYHKLLASYPDTLIVAKRGMEMAIEVMKLARKVLEKNDPMEFRKLDDFLLKDDLNPGTIADLTASSIYLALLEGWKFEIEGLWIEKRNK
ncbi:MAG: triphosphoribosyl-dephospho-CoA synthase [Archaeoglobaceae archaeon]|nr:triphosphoribosyl-dephospho-CoA synthase [Archaeoglobaceae archaeon]MDW8117601.1 triphosphoribosyl-dephospho-CoA synthase [Archaeoglobaceae archaeon]